ncbi:MAG: UTP--glucose-1-phosphate uridylyltransferase GalU [Mucispirillum sp.]|nr:UTP--glucose-1-phosphate uridylyltransferase GalU [Mucispirillum sp.]
MKIRTAVFPVAGFGTRMLPATKAIPKEMITLIDKPLIQYAVEEAINAGIEKIIFITGRTKKALEDHFDINVELNNQLELSGKKDILKDMKRISEMVDIIYVRQKYMLGLGNAVMCVKDIVKDEPFAVILPDDIILSKTPVIKQLIECYDKVECPIISLMPVAKSDTTKYGIVKIKEKIDSRFSRLKDMIEKPEQNPPSNMAIIGRYILTSEVLSALDKIEKGAGGELQLTDALKYTATYHDVYGYEFEGKRFDCGTKEGLLEATINFAASNEKLKNILKETVYSLNIF